LNGKNFPEGVQSRHAAFGIAWAPVLGEIGWISEWRHIGEDRQQPTFIQRRLKSQTTSTNVERDVSAITGFVDR
jgi:hypothetical protein